MANSCHFIINRLLHFNFLIKKYYACNKFQINELFSENQTLPKEKKANNYLRQMHSDNASAIAFKEFHREF